VSAAPEWEAVPQLWGQRRLKWEAAACSEAMIRGAIAEKYADFVTIGAPSGGAEPGRCP